MNDSPHERLPNRLGIENEGFDNRIDSAHQAQHDGTPLSGRASERATRSRRRKQSARVSVGGGTANELSAAEVAEAAPQSWADPRQYTAAADPLPEIVLRHADDLSMHLTDRLREVEERELALADFERRLAEAEAAAQAWVAQNDSDLRRRERDVQLREDEVATRAAAVAAAELAGDCELQQRAAACSQRESDLAERETICLRWEERLQAERAALDQAAEMMRAERRHEEERLRALRQQSQSHLEADREQAERVLANVQRHRAALDARERKLSQQATEATSANSFRSAGAMCENLEDHVAFADMAREQRRAGEDRWVATQLWQRLVRSRLMNESDLQNALQQAKARLREQFAREHESLHLLRKAVAQAASRFQTRQSPARDGHVAALPGVSRTCTRTEAEVSRLTASARR